MEHNQEYYSRIQNRIDKKANKRKELALPSGEVKISPIQLGGNISTGKKAPRYTIGPTTDEVNALLSGCRRSLGL